MILRPYQNEAVDSIFAYWDNGVGKNPLVCAPTGSGKSIIIAEFCKRVCTEWPKTKIVIVTDSRDLISQNEKELRLHYKEASTGIYSAGLGKRQTQAQILLVGIQSIYDKAFKLDKTDIIIIDEAHMLSRKTESRYARFMKDMHTANPNVVVVGLTATPWRADSGMLCDGKDALFDNIAYCADLKMLIKEGYLLPVVSKGGCSKINLVGVHIKAGEWAPGELAHAASDPELIRLAVEEFVEYGKDRKSWLVFCAGIDHAESVAIEIRKHKIECMVVTGDTPNDERDKIIGRFKDGKLRCMVNVGVFIKGFNSPGTDMIVLLTSTRSTSKYVQILGRGMRLAPNKTDCLVMDYGQNIILHGVVDEIDPVRKKNIFNCDPSPPPMRECPKCRAIFHARIMVCPLCGYNFDPPEASANHGTEAYDGAVMSDQQKPFVVEVKEHWFGRHKKPGKPDSMKMAFYDSMGREFAHWLTLDHTGYAADKAQALVKQFGGKSRTVDDALKEQFDWRTVTHVKVQPRGKFFSITGFVFKSGESQQQKLGEE
jgi:DNA repair protein RadD